MHSITNFKKIHFFELRLFIFYRLYNQYVKTIKINPGILS